MTSVLVLFLFYVAGLVLYVVIPVPSKRFLMISISTMIGFVNIPIVKYSVNWWYTLHQPSTISLKNVHIDTSMLVPLLVMFLFVNIYALKLILTDLRQYVISKRILKHKSIS
jgi:heme exporter protein C